MARQVRIEFPGAFYHVMCRGDHQEEIFRDDKDRKRFLETLGEACGKTGWRVHAYVLMGNQYHLLLETPEANLVAGMQWFQGTYTKRFNSRHKLFGHLFQGRYKALNVEEGGSYFETVATYIHLNPVRARLVGTEPGMLREFRWSSFPNYLERPSRRPAWLKTGLLLAESGFDRDDAKARRGFEAWMDARSVECGDGSNEEVERAWRKVRRGWCLGGESFREKLMGLIGEKAAETKRESLGGEAIATHDEAAAAAWLEEAALKVGGGLGELRVRAKGCLEKQVLAWWLRSNTTMSREWIADRLGMGHPSRVTKAVSLVGGDAQGEVGRLRRLVTVR